MLNSRFHILTKKSKNPLQGNIVSSLLANSSSFSYLWATFIFSMLIRFSIQCQFSLTVANRDTNVSDCFCSLYRS